MKYLLILMTFASLCTADVDKTQWEEIHGNGIYTTSQKKEANDKTKAAEKAFKDMERAATQSNLALRAIVKIGVKNLKRHHYYAEAYKMEAEWRMMDGKLIKAVQSRHIGDFEPLSDWLAVAYEILELKLGIDICKTLRLTDIKTINYCIVVVFKPCTYGYSNFYDHFVTDEIYKGLAPVVSYWATVIVCDIASYGAGYFFICSPIGMLVERAVLYKVAPWAAPKLYDLACKNIDSYSYNINDAAH